MTSYKYDIFKKIQLPKHQRTGQQTTPSAKKKLHELCKTASLTCLLHVHFTCNKTNVLHEVN